MPKLVLTGTVVGLNSMQTAKVLVRRRVLNSFYGRIERPRKVYQVHDPQNQCVLGATVRIAYCRPMSKTKHFEFLEELKNE